MSQMSEDSRMPAQLWTLALYLATDGKRGTFSQDGTRMVETSAGLRQSEWNYSSKAFSNSANYQGSKFLAITLKSSKVSRQAGAETKKPTESSEGFTSYWKKAIQSSSPDTSTPLRILPTAPQEVSTHQDTSYFPRLKSQTPSNHSSHWGQMPIY